MSVARSSRIVLGWVVRAMGTVASNAMSVRVCERSGGVLTDTVAPSCFALDFITCAASEAHLEPCSL